MVKVKVPATTANLGPGFDTMGMALDLYNTVEMELTDQLEISVFGQGADDIARDETNIVYQAAAIAFTKANFNFKSLKIKLTNDVPVARGLGSSAAAVVGGVLAANALMGNPLAEQELADLVTEIEGHPDNVLPALIGGVVIAGWGASGLVYKKITTKPALKAAVAIPEFYLKTKEARGVLPSQVPYGDAVFNLNRAALLVAGLMAEDYELLSQVMEDKLHQPYRSKLIPGMDEIMLEVKEAGAIGGVLSGAGPTMLALADRDYDKYTDIMDKIFAKHNIKSTSMVLDIIDHGARIE